MKYYDFKAERGLVSEEDEYETSSTGFNRNFCLGVSIIMAIMVGSAIYFANLSGKAELNSNLLVKRVLKLADTNKNGILEQSELADLIREIEPGYVMPKFESFTINAGNCGGDVLIYYPRASDGGQISLPQICLPKNKLEGYLTKHK